MASRRAIHKLLLESKSLKYNCSNELFGEGRKAFVPAGKVVECPFALASPRQSTVAHLYEIKEKKSAYGSDVLVSHKTELLKAESRAFRQILRHREHFQNLTGSKRNPFERGGANFRPFSSPSGTSSAINSGNKSGKEEKERGRIEASAADCDEAVEGLSSLKAKLQATNDAVKKGKGVLLASFELLKSLIVSIWTSTIQIPSLIKAVLSMSRKDWQRKLLEWYKVVVHTLQHYWVGSKLLYAETRISARLMLKLAKGKDLTRRERRQLTRTSADLFRLVPFAVFILVPFMEFALPIALRFFPNMLPSTFQDKMQEEVSSFPFIFVVIYH